MTKTTKTTKTKEVRQLEIELIEGSVNIVGTSPLIVHAWSPKALREMYGKQTGAAKAPRQTKDPEADYEAAAYKLPDGRHGFSIEAIKRSMKNAAMQVSIKEASKIAQAIYMFGVRTDRPTAHEGASGSLHLVPLVCSEPKNREDLVRVGGATKSADIRYRPEYTHWAIRIAYRLNPAILSEDELAGYLAQAGHGVGVGEWRPQKNGPYGTFRLATADEAEMIDNDPDGFIEQLRLQEEEDTAMRYPDNRRKSQKIAA